MTAQLAPAALRGRALRYLAPAALGILLAAVIVVVVSVPSGSSGSGPHAKPAAASRVAVRRLPPYWIVRPGETFMKIAAKTGLTVAQLEAFNPQEDPMSIVPGERLNLWLHPPMPRPKPPGPMFWLVRAGQSFGSIAAKTGISIVRLEELNSQLKPAMLQPGDRVRLRAS
jgi:LysM repeat protein